MVMATAATCESANTTRSEACFMGNQCSSGPTSSESPSVGGLEKLRDRAKRNGGELNPAIASSMIFIFLR